MINTIVPSSVLIIFKKMYIYVVCVAVATLCFVQYSSAQNKIKAGLISGTIIDSVTKEPSGFVTVSLKTERDSLLKTTISKADGKFKFENVKLAVYHLVIVSTSYKKKMVNVDLTSSGEINLTISLTGNTRNLKEAIE